jgi:hypothetical protein
MMSDAALAVPPMPSIAVPASIAAKSLFLTMSRSSFEISS